MEGLHPYRLKPNAGNPREVVLAKLWKEESKANLLEHLFTVPCSEDDKDKSRHSHQFGWYKTPLGDVQDRDRIVAATIVQWLGSPVGFSFLNEAIKKCGYRIVPIENGRHK